MLTRFQGLFVVLLLMVLAVGQGHSADETPANSTAPENKLSILKADQVVLAGGISSRHPNLPGNDVQLKMGERLIVTATGTYAADIQAALIKTPPEIALSLYFYGTKIPGIPVGIVSSADTKILIYFDLIRDSSNESNRKAWDSLFKQKSEIAKMFKLSLGVGSHLPLAISPESTFVIRVASGEVIAFSLITCLLAFVVGFYLLTRTHALRDGASTHYYSLGKSQMAFWGLLVILAFIGVFFVNGTMEQIPQQMLMLLGISGATGLGAIIIGESKNAAKVKRVSDLQAEASEIVLKQSDNIATAKDLARLEQIPQEIKALQDSSTESTGSFWRDICDDGNGLSFHRLQVVMWTIVLGVIFVVSVYQQMSMPEFPGSLLILMGVSNGTYLGFKIPEK